MPVDMRKVLSAAVLAAIKEAQSAPPAPARPKKARLTTGKALLVGAGVVTAGRLLAGPKAKELLGSVQQRLEDAVGDGDASRGDVAAEEEFDDEYDDEPEAEADVDDEYDDEPAEDVDDEPDDEPAEDVDDEPDDEPEAEVDDEPDDEPEAEVDGDEPETDDDRAHGSEGRRRPKRSPARARGRR